MKVWILFCQLLAILVVGFVLSACGQDGSESTLPTSELAPNQPEAVTTPFVEPAGQDSFDQPAAASEIQSGRVDSADTDTSIPLDFGAMLGSMGDYQMEMNVAFAGLSQAGAPVAYEWQSRESVLIDPPRSRVDIQAVRGGEQAGIESITLVRQGESGYLYVPAVGCISGSDVTDNLSLPLDAGSLLKGVTGASSIGSGVVVNGVETTQFQLDETNLPWSSSGPWTIVGNAYVEESSNLLSRVILKVSGIGDLLGEGRILDGDYSITINVTNNVAAESVVIPAACVEAFRYPITPDAYDVTVIDDLLSFRSRQSLAEVVAFYSDKMPGDGWQLLSEPDVFDDLAIMSYQRNDVPLMISVDYDPETGTVGVLISP